MDIVVRTPAGSVSGVTRASAGTRSHAFLGIPFAQAPVGPLRFAAPARPEPWEGVRDATRPGPTPQRRPLSAVTTIPEASIPGDDVLNVSVFTPDPSARGLPVLVWFHGGAYVGGSPVSPWYDGASFNRDGVVTVNVAYRLGHQGFGTIPGTVANRGVLDWLAALRWVQESIAAFGGDPAKVTIAGQSAGGGAVLHLLALESAHGLFRSAISLSGVTAELSAQEGLARARRVAATAGVPCTREGFASLSEEALLDAQAYATPRTDGLETLRMAIGVSHRPSPVIDGDVVPTPILEALRAGTGSEVSVLLGSAEDECTTMARVASDEISLLGEVRALGALGLAEDAARRYVQDNPVSATAGPVALAGRFVTDAVYRSVVPDVAGARGGSSTWAYRWAWPSPVSGMAEHCHDVPFFFDRLDDASVTAFAGPRPPRELADDLHSSAVRFIQEGDPGWAEWGATGIARIIGTDLLEVPGAYHSAREASAFVGR